MRVPSPWVTVAAVVASVCMVAGVAGCTGDGTPAPGADPVAPTTALPASLPSTAPDDVSPAGDTVPDPSRASSADGVTRLSPDGPWRLVDSAPGIESPGSVYELMPGLWVFLPSERDLDHGVVWTFHERDRELIEDWLRAMVVYHRGVTADPMRFEGDEWDTWFPSRDMPILSLLEQRRASGQHLDLDLGLVLRPVVLGEQRTDTTAIVFDCELDGSVIVDRNGAVVPPSYRGVADDGRGYRMARVDGSWRVVEIGSQPTACA